MWGLDFSFLPFFYYLELALVKCLLLVFVLCSKVKSSCDRDLNILLFKNKFGVFYFLKKCHLSLLRVVSMVTNSFPKAFKMEGMTYQT